MISNHLHLQYARALHNIALKEQVEEQLWHELKSLNDLFQHKKLQKLMDTFAFYPHEAKLEMIVKTFEGKVHAYILNLLKVLTVKNRLELLTKIYKTYSQLYHQQKGIAELTVFTAQTLSKEEEHELKTDLEKKKQHWRFPHQHHDWYLI